MRADPTLMQAWIADAYGPPDAMAVHTLPLPVPGEGMVLLRVSHVALNPLDLKLLQGDLAQMMPLQFPFTPGADVSGAVVARGAGIDLPIGTRVAAMAPGFGALAQYCAVPAGARLSALPDDLDGTRAAALPMVGLTAIAIERAARLAAGQQLAIIGAAGGVGTILLQLLRQRQVHITATAHPGDTAFVLDKGANEVIPYQRGDDVRAMMASHRLGGFDVVIDLVNQGAALESALQLVRRGGRFISTLFGPTPESCREQLELVYIRLSPEPGDLARLLGQCAAGELDANLGQTFPFAQAHEAFARLRSGHRGKTIIDLLAVP